MVDFTPDIDFIPDIDFTPDDSIGFLKAAAERPLEKIPFSPVKALRTLKIVESGKRLGSFDYAFTEKDVIRKYPNVHPAHIKRISKNANELYQKDVNLVTKYLDDLAEKERQGYSLMGQVGQIISEMPAFMIEFLSTGGLQKLGTVTAKKFGTKLLGKYAATIAGKAALATGGFAVGTAVRAAGMPHRASEAILRRQLPRDIKITDAGAEITGPVEKPITAIWKGLTDHYIEIASEQAGEVVAPLASKIFTKLPFIGKFTGALQNQWLRLNPNKTATAFMKKISTKAGYHGVVGEIGEEYLGDALRAITDVEHFGAGEDADMLERLVAGVKQDTENLPAMAIAFAIPGAVRGGVGAVIQTGLLTGPISEQITNVQDAERIVEETPNLTPEQKEIGLRYIGNIETNVINEIVERFPGKINNQESLEKIGNQIVEYLNIPKITWNWDTTYKGRKKLAFYRPSIHSITFCAFHPNLKAEFTGFKYARGLHFRTIENKTPGDFNQDYIKQVIIHEIGHYVKPGGKQYHTPEFYNWVEENIAQLSEEISRVEPVHREEAMEPIGEPTPIITDPLTKLARLQEQIDQTVLRGEKPSQELLDEIKQVKKDLRKQEREANKPSKEQYKAGHEIPKMLKMTERQRKNFMRKTVGKRSMAKMIPSEAQEYIEALYELAKEKGIEIGILPAERKFKEPTIIAKPTPQLYEAEILGVKFMVDPAVIGKQKLDVEFRKIGHKLRQMRKLINRLGKETAASRAKAKLLNKPTKSIKRFTELLNKYEDPPANLSKEEKDIFNYFRTLSKAIWIRENRVREKLDMKPIPYKVGYMRHIVDTLAQDIIDDRHPIPEELKYWAEKHTTIKITNPMEFQRKLGDELTELFSDDLIRASQAMVWTGLKEIHLDEPLKFFERQLGLHSEVIPAGTRRWTEDFINTMIKGQQTQTDKELDRLVTEGGLGKLINKILKPFGRKVSHRPLTRLLQKTGRLQIYGVMGWRPKQLIRNKFQLFQNLALYTTKANMKSFLPAEGQLKKLLSESLFLETYKGFEDLADIDRRILGRLWLAPFQWTAVSNVKQAMKCAYWDTLELIEDPKYKNLGWADPKRTYKEESGILYASEKEKILKEMEFGAGVTQYHYIPMAMPEVFRSKRNIPLTRLQSWWMNYFFKFHREAGHRLLKGETQYGTKLPWSRRIGWARYLVIGGVVLNTLGYTSSYLLGAAPDSTPPIFQLLINLYKYIITDNDRTRASAARKFKNALKTFIPGHLAYKDAKALWTGKSKLHQYFFYTKGIFKKEEKKRGPRKGF